MNLASLPLCARARELLAPLRAGRASEAGLLRHVAACPRCRSGLAALQRDGGRRRAPERAGYVLAVVHAAARARLAALLGELAHACAADHPATARRAAPARGPREAAAVLHDLARLQRRLASDTDRELTVEWPQLPPPPARALSTARACLLAAERLDGPSETRQLQLAACALLGGDDAAAGALCSGLVASAGQRDERARLARRAGAVAREWGLPSERLLPLLRQPARAGCN